MRQMKILKIKCIEIEKYDFRYGTIQRDNPGFDFDCTEWKYDIDIKDRIVGVRNSF